MQCTKYVPRVSSPSSESPADSVSDGVCQSCLHFHHVSLSAASPTAESTPVTWTTPTPRPAFRPSSVTGGTSFDLDLDSIDKADSEGVDHRDVELKRQLAAGVGGKS